MQVVSGTVMPGTIRYGIAGDARYDMVCQLRFGLAGSERFSDVMHCMVRYGEVYPGLKSIFTVAINNKNRYKNKNKTPYNTIRTL